MSEENAALIKHYADKISVSTVRNDSDHRRRIRWAERIIELIHEDDNRVEPFACDELPKQNLNNFNEAFADGLGIQR